MDYYAKGDFSRGVEASHLLPITETALKELVARLKQGRTYSSRGVKNSSFITQQLNEAVDVRQTIR